MNDETRKALIGASVIGAVALAVVGVIAFGSGRLFSRTQTYVQYFDESVKGLSVGAPVMFRGVKIGSVVAIRLEGDFNQLKFAIPVITEVDTDVFSLGVPPGRIAETHQSLIEKGLRAQLQMQSFVTGQLMINLDFHPGRPARLVPDGPGYLQIPTIASASQELTRKLDDLPLQDLLDRANTVLDRLGCLLEDPVVRALPAAVSDLVADTRGLILHADHALAPAFADLSRTFAAVTGAATALERTLAFREGPSAELLSRVTEACDKAGQAFATLDLTLQSANAILQDGRPIEEAREAFREAAQAAQALRVLAETVERHPEAMLRGKKAERGRME